MIRPIFDKYFILFFCYIFVYTIHGQRNNIFLYNTFFQLYWNGKAYFRFLYYFIIQYIFCVRSFRHAGNVLRVFLVCVLGNINFPVIFNFSFSSNNIKWFCLHETEVNICSVPFLWCSEYTIDFYFLNSIEYKINFRWA